GETIREIHQDTPFSMVALTADSLDGTTARIRAQHADGGWGPWYDAETLEGVGPDRPDTHGTEPIFVGRTHTVQIAVTRTPPPPAAAPHTRTAPPRTPPPLRAPPNAGRGRGHTPANVEQPLPQNVNAVLISPPEAPVD